MSYILDALRKADAQRERDPARGIHAQPVAPLDETAPRPNVLAWGAIATGVVVAAAAGYWFAGRGEPPLRAHSGAVMPAPVAVPVPLPPPVQKSGVQVAVQPAAPPVVVKAPPPVVKAAAAKVEAPKAEAPKADVAANAQAPRAAAPPRVLALAELPQDVQRELPKLAVSGGVYSENPAQRMLIVGGQVVNEGSQVAPGVVLEQIRERSAVLKFKTYRYSVGY